MGKESAATKGAWAEPLFGTYDLATGETIGSSRLERMTCSDAVATAGIRGVCVIHAGVGGDFKGADGGVEVGKSCRSPVHSSSAGDGDLGHSARLVGGLLPGGRRRKKVGGESACRRRRQLGCWAGLSSGWRSGWSCNRSN